MTIWDQLGPHAGDLASWAESRATWTTVKMAEELWLRRLVSTREDLDRYREAVLRELEAFKSSRSEAIGEDEMRREMAALTALKSAVVALVDLEWSRFNRVAIRMALAEDARQRARRAI